MGKSLILATVTALVTLATGAAPAALAASSYDDAVLVDRPSLFLPLDAGRGAAVETDLASGGGAGRYLPEHSNFAKTRLPNGDVATVFDGTSQYVEVPSAPSLSVPEHGALTFEAWIRPDTLNFPVEEGEGYVHWAGKGETGSEEYVLRMYSRANTARPSRPNRISGYAFSPGGGFGSGSYFQDAVVVGAWIHVALIIDPRPAGAEFPTGKISIFRDGVLRKTTALVQYDVVPAPGEAPLRIGTRDFRSFFRGAIAKVAVYDHAVPAGHLLDHYRAMSR